ncbi:GGDEF domain-containing protein [Vibrio stylophorae]|nr:GGDEF domain-containing protein [Vibrio stylophorae]
MSRLSFSLCWLPESRLFLPLVVVVLTVVSLPASWLNQTHLPMLIELPYVLLGLALLLSHLYHQGRNARVALLLLVAYYIIQTRLQAPLTMGTTRLEYVLLGSLLSLNLLYLTLFSELRLWGQKGILYLFFLLLQIGWGALVIDYDKAHDISYLWQGYLFHYEPWSPFPILSLCMIGICTLIAALLALKRHQTGDHAIYIALLVSSFTFVFFSKPLISATLFSLGGLFLLLGLLRCSLDLAFVDALTGIHGRRALESELKHVGRCYTLAMLDVDHFKKFNDTYGHETGDDVLKVVAKLMQETGCGAQAYRYGGEEFTILFRGKTSRECLEALDQLRCAIADYPLYLRNNKNRPEDDEAGRKRRGQNAATKAVHVTISIGVADNQYFDSVDETLKAADKALYGAKKKGRNCVQSAVV